MRKQVKKNSIEELKSAISLAETFGEVDSDQETNLDALLEEYLYADDTPQRRALRAEFLAGGKRTGKDGIRRRLGMVDLAFFGRAYLPHYFSKASPVFHADLDSLWHKVWKCAELTKEAIKLLPAKQGTRQAVAAPRGHAKSTNLTFKDTLHAVLYAYKHYILIMSDVADQANGFLAAIKEELEDNDAIREDFGDLSGRVWRDDVIVTKTGIKVQAKGAGQKVRGLKHKHWRPDLIVLDDIENDENVRTPEQRAKLESWFWKAVSKCGDSYTDIVYIGTILHYDSLLSKVLKNPGYESRKYKAVMSFSSSKLWDQWAELYNDLSDPAHQETARDFFEDHKTEMLAGTQVLWEEKLSYYDLMEMRLTEGDASFNSEEQNEPINPEDCLFNEEWFEYFDMLEIDVRDKRNKLVGFVDPSLGKSKKSDTSGIITLIQDHATGYIYTLDADVMRRHPDAIIEDCIQKAIWLQTEFGRKYDAFGAETNQFQWFLKEQLAKESARRRVYLPIVEVNQTSDKVLRIQTLQPYVKNKYIRFRKNQKTLLEQLKYFPMADHDDGPDALEGAVTLLNKKRRKIRAIKGLGL